MKKIFVIDNYDSFTYNLVHYLEELDCEVTVKRNDQFDLDELENYPYILLSPGPGIPDESGLLKAAIERYAPSKKILGVCLGNALEKLLAKPHQPRQGISRYWHPVKVTQEDVLFKDLPSVLR